MPVNQYECLVMFDTSKLSGNQEAAKETVNATLTKYGCEIMASRNWDERKLAYPIDGQKKGLYYLAYFKADSSKIDPIQSDFKINESILRFMTIKIPTKWEEEMSAVAKDETRFAYQSLREDADGGDSGLDGLGDDMGMGREGRGGGGRRRRDEPMKD
jgi:small subunit ribosomal protein S6